MRGRITIRASNPAREVESRLPIKDGRTADAGASGMLGRWPMPLGLIVTDVARGRMYDVHVRVGHCTVVTRVYRGHRSCVQGTRTGPEPQVTAREVNESMSFRFAIVHRQTWNENRIEIHDNMKIVTS